MKKILVVVMVIILITALYFVYAKSVCKMPFQEMFVISRNDTGVISDQTECKYVGWKSRYSKPLDQ